MSSATDRTRFSGRTAWSASHHDSAAATGARATTVQVSQGSRSVVASPVTAAPSPVTVVSCSETTATPRTSSVGR